MLRLVPPDLHARHDAAHKTFYFAAKTHIDTEDEIRIRDSMARRIKDLFQGK